ncbi:hypothetical protein GCM10009802_44680 [Streptomyces synnematoformans]|uniref:Uncharacterized protein n=1 Tax=Streptomyces synnematoformans TaxID=415721 RepID=A0ABN2Z2V6_9ACTN
MGSLVLALAVASVRLPAISAAAPAPAMAYRLLDMARYLNVLPPMGGWIRPATGGFWRFGRTCACQAANGFVTARQLAEYDQLVSSTQGHAPCAPDHLGPVPTERAPALGRTPPRRDARALARAVRRM